jgi:hypothetical protein
VISDRGRSRWRTQCTPAGRTLLRH